MILTHQQKTPQIHPTAYVAPTATICGDVKIGPHCRILFGACVIAEGGSIEIGAHGIVLENAVIRSTALHSTRIGDYCLVGPNAHVAGCEIEKEVFIATGAAVFHGATIGTGSEVRMNGVVHVKTKLAPNTTVPIGWVAVGDPATVFPPHEQDKIWAIQKPLNFPLAVYGIDRTDATMVKITEKMSRLLGEHVQDKPLP
jgi:carbonic anhydrase/acetyltransferase-like protein (isoleucine patch superfamily)